MTDRSGLALSALPRRRSDELIVRQVGEEIAIYDVHASTVTALDPRAALVWNGLDTAATIEDLVAATGLDPQDVDAVVEQLRRAGFFVAEPSRRFVLKRVGVATALAPLLAIAAPTAAMAASWSTSSVVHTCTSNGAGGKVDTVTIVATLNDTVRSIPATFTLTQGGTTQTYSTPTPVVSTRSGTTLTLSLTVNIGGASPFTNAASIGVSITLYAGSLPAGATTGNTLSDTINFSSNAKTCS